MLEEVLELPRQPDELGDVHTGGFVQDQPGPAAADVEHLAGVARSVTSGRGEQRLLGRPECGRDAVQRAHRGAGAPVAEDADAVAELLDRALHAAPLLLDLGHQPTDAADAAEQAVRSRCGTPRRSLVQRSPYVAISGTFEEFLAARSSTFVARIRQRRRKLGESGELRLVFHDGRDDPDVLDAALGLEGSVRGGAAGHGAGARSAPARPAHPGAAPLTRPVRWPAPSPAPAPAGWRCR